MSVSQDLLRETKLSEIPETLQDAGVSGAGGAGFPTYAKWLRLDEVDHLMVNHQESEPDYYIDKWVGVEYAEELATLFEALLDRAFETVIVGVKAKDREEWMGELEAATDGTVYMPEDLPVDPDEESGVVFTYTQDNYQLGMENILLQQAANVVIGQDLPMDHGFIVQNTETMYNVYRALEDGTPVTRKWVHVDGETPRHRFLEVPVGTTASALLNAADLAPEELAADQVLLDGGPGWCFEIEEPPDEFGVRKRTNCLLVANEDTVEEYTRGDERVDLLEAYDWDDGRHETEPTETLQPEVVRVPMITNPAFEGLVLPGEPVVEPGDQVEEGDVISRPASGEGFSIAHHASIDGEVAAVSDTHVEIRR